MSLGIKEETMSAETEWLEITWKEHSKSGKTSIFDVHNKVFDCHVGVIKYNPAWRKYVLYPDDGTGWDASCLRGVMNFIVLLMWNRKVE